jgi:glyoxylase-like metal-dependent hydrolase (beta-lactamase superfamily II)
VNAVSAIQTGSVRIKAAQVEAKGTPLASMGHILFDSDWADWLPIYAWVIQHEEGAIVVDTGETARVHDAGYHPRWHPYIRWAAQFRVQPEEEIGPQLKRMGINPADVRQVVLTHLHTDHAGGLAHFPKSKIWVSQPEYEAASGFLGKVRGYLPHRWPQWWKPVFVPWASEAVGPFTRSFPLTRRGDVVAVSAPGHTPGHLAVIVRDDVSVFIAGDITYNERLLRAGKVDGVSPNQAVSLATAKAVLKLAESEKLVYLPSHDPDGPGRLAALSLVNRTG